MGIQSSLGAMVVGIALTTALTTGALFTFGVRRESLYVRVVRTGFLVAFAAAVGLCVMTALLGPQEVMLGTWFSVGTHAFDLRLAIDLLSASLLVLVFGACSLIGHFSRTYLHGESGHSRFYFLLSVFAFGMVLIVSVESLDFVFVGWELVGITSALLIGFFHERSTPIRHGLRAFATYRICDVGFLTAIVLLHHFAHDANMHPAHNVWAIGEGLTASASTWVAIALLFGAMGKSAQFPFGGWLTRAMEGPTPSSAIFYGALSVHAGVYLLIRAAPLFEASPTASVALCVVGVLTAITATLTGRVQSDVKGALAYATMTQVGLMFVEIGLHLPELAALHLVGHAALRTSQFLRAPAILHELHRVHGALPREFSTGRHLERVFPRRLAEFLYVHAIERFHVDQFLDRVVVRPFFAFAGLLLRVEHKLAATSERHDLAGQQTHREVHS